MIQVFFCLASYNKGDSCAALRQMFCISRCFRAHQHLSRRWEKMRFGSPTNDAKVNIAFETAKCLRRFFVKYFFDKRRIA